MYKSTSAQIETYYVSTQSHAKELHMASYAQSKGVLYTHTGKTTVHQQQHCRGTPISPLKIPED